MSEWLTVALTILGEVVVFVGGQIAQRFFLEPIQDQRKVIGEIAYVLLYHDNVGRFMAACVSCETPNYPSGRTVFPGPNGCRRPSVFPERHSPACRLCARTRTQHRG